MRLEQFYNDFTDKIAACSYQKDLSLQIISSQKESISTKYKKYLKENKADTPIEINIDSIYLWENRQIMRFSERNVSVNFIWNSTIYYHNKLHQWLLATSFEAFEVYLKQIYPLLFAGKTPNSADKILKKIRETYANYKKVEQNKVIPFIESNTINNAFQLAMIEKMRHKIVHANGIVNNRKYFLEDILESIGLINNGNYDIKYKNTVDTYFNNVYAEEIVLLDIPVFESSGFSAQTTVLNNLFSVMLNSAYYIKLEIEKTGKT